jgi:hypothetical protein
VVNGSLNRSKGFTLIECVPRVMHAETWWLQRTTPVNCSLQTGSLTADFRRRGDRSAVTTSPVGNLCRDGGRWPAPKTLPGNGEPTACRTPETEPTERLVVSLSGKAKTQAVGKRTSASIVKVNWRALLTEPGILGSRSSARWEKAAIIGVASGQTHSMTRRCKRRRHVSRVSRSNWGGPPRSSSADGVRPGIRRHAQSLTNAVAGVGDAHSSEEPRDNKTHGERRGISLKTTSDEERSG